MPGERILVVEDDGIIGRHIQSNLIRLGYEVLDVLPTGEEAVACTAKTQPDLVLMDVSLAGEIDGVEAARQIHQRHNLPVVFLTAYADQATLQRVKITDPFGYLLKPFDQRVLQVTIEMALYKHAMEKRLVENEELLRNLIENQGEGVIIVRPNGEIAFSNPALEVIFDEPHGSLLGKDISDYVDSGELEKIRARVEKCARKEKVIYETDLTRRSGERRSISVTATPWLDKNGEYSGTLAIISDITERKAIEAAERAARTLAEALRETAVALIGTLELEEVLDQVLVNAQHVVPHDGANVILVEGDTGRIVRGYGNLAGGDPKPLVQDRFLWRDLPILSEQAETGRPLVIADFENADIRRGLKMEWMRSYLGVSMQVNYRLVGFINLGCATPGFFTTDHARQLEAFASQAALAIENARLFEETRKRARFMALLNEITHSAISAVDLNQTMTMIAAKMAELFQSDGAFITSWDEDHQLTIPTAGYGYTSETYPALQCNPGELTLTASVLRLGQALAVEDVLSSPYIDHRVAETFPLQSLMGLPLIADGVRLGAVIIGFKERHCFTGEEIAQGEQASSQVALALAKAKLYTQVQLSAVTDELTGLFNRRGIMEKGREALLHAAHSGNPLALIWLDIDRFKEVNDTYGHYIGDQVVRGVAERCRSSVRNCDWIGRYGGEGGDELIVLLPDADLVAARQVAERLRERIASQPFPTDKGEISVTVSLGISYLRSDSMDLSALLNQADQAMYAAKLAGRNCVAVAGEL